jgi:hypothetical protein
MFQDRRRLLKNQTMTSIFYPNDCALRNIGLEEVNIAITNESASFWLSAEQQGWTRHLPQHLLQIGARHRTGR